MDEDFVYIEGDFEEDERERLLRLIRRVEKAVEFQFEAEGLTPTWIIVVGWGSGDTGPIRISRFRSGLIFSAPDVDGAARKMERWLGKHG